MDKNSEHRDFQEAMKELRRVRGSGAFARNPTETTTAAATTAHFTVAMMDFTLKAASVWLSSERAPIRMSDNM